MKGLVLMALLVIVAVPIFPIAAIAAPFVCIFMLLGLCRDKAS